jgi:hypothetical protein
VRRRLAIVACLAGVAVAMSANSPARAVSPQAASGYKVTVTPTKNAKATVRVTISGLPDTVGLYVRYCKLPAAGQRPAPEDCLNAANSGFAGVWAVARYPYGTAPSDGSVVNPRKPFTMTIAPTIGSIDCRTTACGIVVRRDHRAGSDTSYDRSIRVRLAP